MNKSILDCLKKSTLFILPVIFVIIALIIHFGKGNFFMTHVDPEYFHLFNGLNLAIFNLAVDFIHHPGTTIQIIFAVSAHIVNFIQPGNDLIKNALNNPEQFIHGANILLNLLTGITLLTLGIYTYRYSGNIFFALIIQLMPFASYKILLISGRLIPETALIAPILLLALLMVKHLYDQKREKDMQTYIIGFAIIGGLGIAGKLLYLPFLIIPLFFIPTIKLRLKYLAYTFIAIVVFAFPVFVHIGKSWEWFGSMLLHSGQWGGGEQNVFNINAAPGRLKTLYQIDKSFFVILGLAAIQLIAFYLLSFFRNMNAVRLNMKMLLAVVLSVALSILMVTKHFALHYYIPTLLFKGFLIFMMTKLLVDVFHSKLSTRIISIGSLIIMLLIVSGQRKSLATANQKNQEWADLFQERAFILQQYNTIDNPLIITSHYRGSTFIESAMVAGVLMSGSLKTTFLADLTEMYPNTYFYYDWSDDFYFWDKFKNAKEFIDLQKPVYIFIGEGMEVGLEVILERLKEAFPDQQPEINLLHHFTDPDEYFYEVRLQ